MNRYVMLMYHRKVSRVWQSLYKTYSTPTLSILHTTAACNAVGSFLDAGTTSTNDVTRQLVAAPATWLATFDVYLTRFEDAKPKPMKQVLLSLVKILKKHQANAHAILSNIADMVIPCIVLGGTRSQLKASLVSLETFVRKSAIKSTPLFQMIDDWLVNNHKKWTPLRQKDCETLSIDVPRFINGDSNAGKDSKWRQEVAAQIFALGAMSRTKNSDFASPTGSMLAAIFHDVEASTGPNDEARSLSSAWATPIRHYALLNMGALETITSQILYPLFNAGFKGFHRFVNTLPLQNLLAGEMGNASIEELMILFSSLQIAKRIGLVREDCELLTCPPCWELLTHGRSWSQGNFDRRCRGLSRTQK